jgi:PAS domain S-box-containing protein
MGALDNSELDATLRLVMDAAPAMIWLSGVDNDCTWVNRSWLKFTGRRLDAELGAGWMEIIHRDDLDRCLEFISSHFDAQKKWRARFRARRYDGVYRWVEDSGNPRFAADGTFAGYIGAVIDLHDWVGVEQGTVEQGTARKAVSGTLGKAKYRPTPPMRDIMRLFERDLTQVSAAFRAEEGEGAFKHLLKFVVDLVYRLSEGVDPPSDRCAIFADLVHSPEASKSQESLEPRP